MTHHETLLANCLDDPDSDVARGVYADWLRDNGTEAEQLLGRFIASSLVLHEFREAAVIDERRHEEAVKEFDDEMIARVVGSHAEKMFGRRRWSWNSEKGIVHVAVKSQILLTYRRGMIDQVQCRLVDWAKVAKAVLPVAPVRLWRFFECEWLTLAMGREEYGWCVDLEFDRPEQKLRGVSFTIGGANQPVVSGPAEGRAERLRKKIGIRPHRTRSGLIADLVEHGGFFWLLRHILNVVGFQALGLPDLTPETLDRLHLALEGDDLVSL